jgi:transmembrane sensor
MERNMPSKRGQHVDEAASEWFVEFRTGEPSEATRRAFLAWLQESPAHMRAYIEVTALWNDTGAANRDRRWSIEELIREGRSDEGTVVQLGSSVSAPELAAGAVASSQSGGSRKPRSARLRTSVLAAAASIVVLLIAGVIQWSVARNTYATGVGEQRSITLADGSTIELNSRSSVHVHFTKSERQVELTRGQALFQVAKDPSRPFIVTSAATRVRAVGTRFDVYQKASGTVVTVVEGKVAVSNERAAVRSWEALPQAAGSSSNDVERAAGSLQPIYLSAGEQVTVPARRQAKDHVQARAINVAAVVAWTQRELVFESTPLAEVAEEFNRYNERQLVIRDASLREFQIDGVFSSSDPASLIRFLRARANVQVSETGSSFILERQTKLP